MTTVLRQNKKAQTRLQQQLETLKEEQAARNAAISRISSEMRQELTRMKAIGDMYRQYSLANLTTKRKIRRKWDSEVPSISGNEGTDDGKQEDEAPEGDIDEDGSQKSKRNTKDKSREEDHNIIPTGPFGLYRGKDSRSNYLLKGQTRTFVRTTGAFTLNANQNSQEKTETDEEEKVHKKVSVLMKKLAPRGTKRVNPEPVKNTTHITNFYGFHTVTETNDEVEDVQRDVKKPADLNRESSAMFARRRAALLPPNIKTAYALNRFIKEKETEVIKEATPEKLRQKKVGKLIPLVKFPEIIQRGRNLSAIIRDHEQYQQNKKDTQILRNVMPPVIQRQPSPLRPIPNTSNDCQCPEVLPDETGHSILNQSDEETRNDLLLGNPTVEDEVYEKVYESSEETPPHIIDDSDAKQALVRSSSYAAIDKTEPEERRTNPAFKLLVTEKSTPVGNHFKKSRKIRLEPVEEII